MNNLISNQLETLGINSNGSIYFQIPVAELVEHALANHEAHLTDSGALSFNTGEFTGRSPRSRFLVKDSSTLTHVDWGQVNKPMTSALFDELFNRAKTYLSSIPIYVRLSHVCNHPNYKQNILSICESPCQDLFVNNMFTPPTSIGDTSIDWTILVASSLKINDFETLELPNSHCVSIDLTRRQIVIIGTAYTGEIKKSIFSALNYILPLNNDVLTMHCAANVGPKNDTALFFGLSGTGKTTLSSDHERILIGDDEHGWDKESIFNYEGA
ncbi:MAG: phosphoenolpyruvate carboxykinase (ATP) [Sphingobacterium sp.]